MEQTNSLIRIEGLQFSYAPEHPLFNDLSLTIKKGCITTLLGANGCGKSTLFNLMTKNLKAQAGSIDIEGRPVSAIPLKEFAQLIAVVQQKNTAPSDISVRKLVSYGRIPYKHSLMCQAGETKEDKDCIEWALRVTDTEKFQDKQISELSGGQMQRVWIALALAQDTDILFLDEPTTFLDVRYQLQVLRLARRLNDEFGKTIVMVLHDINQALYYSDEIIALSGGQVVHAGSPQELANTNLLQTIYDVELEVLNTDHGNFVLPI